MVDLLWIVLFPLLYLPALKESRLDGNRVTPVWFVLMVATGLSWWLAPVRIRPRTTPGASRPRALLVIAPDQGSTHLQDLHGSGSRAAGAAVRDRRVAARAGDGAA
jgi:hypothetical protein